MQSHLVITVYIMNADRTTPLLLSHDCVNYASSQSNIWMCSFLHETTKLSKETFWHHGQWPTSASEQCCSEDWSWCVAHRNASALDSTHAPLSPQNAVPVIYYCLLIINTEKCTLYGRLHISRSLNTSKKGACWTLQLLLTHTCSK